MPCACDTLCFMGERERRARGHGCVRVPEVRHILLRLPTRVKAGRSSKLQDLCLRCRATRLCLDNKVLSSVKTFITNMYFTCISVCKHICISNVCSQLYNRCFACLRVMSSFVCCFLCPLLTFLVVYRATAAFPCGFIFLAPARPSISATLS